MFIQFNTISYDKISIKFLLLSEIISSFLLHPIIITNYGFTIPKIKKRRSSFINW